MFKEARWRLTLWYSLLVVLISGSLSLLFYVRAANVVQDEYNRIEQRIQREINNFGPQFALPPGRQISLEDLEVAKRLIAFQLLLINSVIVILFSAVAYWLAGITLKPIRLAHEEQKRFVGDAAHELKTPIAALRTSLEVNLMDKSLPPATRKILKENLSDVFNLQALGDNLLKLARVDGKNFQFKPIVAIDGVKRTVKIMTPLAKKKKIKLKIKNNADREKILGDYHTFLDLLTVFLDNAIKYSQPGDLVEIELKRQKNNLLIIITDQGCGIPAQSLPHIFDRFYQVDQARSKSSGSGVGLGLAVAKKIIDQFGGSIRVRSTLGQGSTFILILPVTNQTI